MEGWSNHLNQKKPRGPVEPDANCKLCGSFVSKSLLAKVEILFLTTMRGANNCVHTGNCVSQRREFKRRKLLNNNTPQIPGPASAFFSVVVHRKASKHSRLLPVAFAEIFVVAIAAVHLRDRIFQAVVEFLRVGFVQPDPCHPRVASYCHFCHANARASRRGPFHRKPASSELH